MANPEHLAKLKEGVDAWNEWTRENSKVIPDLSGADLTGLDLRTADLRGALLDGADLSGTDLTDANLLSAKLGCANSKPGKMPADKPEDDHPVQG